MKAITIRQPWASLIVSLDQNGRPLKSVETRSWKTGYRGPLAIHAGKFRPDMFFMGMNGKKMDIFAEAGLHGDNDILNLPYGAVIGKVTLVDCLPLEELAGYGTGYAPGKSVWQLVPGAIRVDSLQPDTV